MKKKLLQLFIVPAIILGIGSCSNKGSDGGGGGGGTTEANLVVTLNPPAGSTQPAAPQIDFPLTVSIHQQCSPQGLLM
jgi:hypothetical protein